MSHGKPKRSGGGEPGARAVVSKKASHFQTLYFEADTIVIENMKLLATQLHQPVWKTLAAGFHLLSSAGTGLAEPVFRLCVEGEHNGLVCLDPTRQGQFSELVEAVGAQWSRRQEPACSQGLTFCFCWGVPHMETNCDLTLNLVESQDGMVAAWRYHSRRFDEAAIHNMHRLYLDLLVASADRPEAPVRELMLVF